MRRFPSIVLITSTLVAAAVALAPTPAAAADVTTDPPATVANNLTAGQVTFTVGSAHALSLTTLASAEVDLTGPDGSADPVTFTDSSPDVTVGDGTVTATFNFTDPGPLAPPPGDYTASIIKKPAIGNPSTLDTATVVVTNPQPTFTSPAAGNPVHVAAGQPDVPLTLTAAGGSNFAAGDSLSFTKNGDPVDGLSFSNPDLESTTFSGDISATRAVATGSYDITVTDAVGGTAVCTNCVTVDDGTGAVADLAATSITHTAATLTWSAPSSGPTPTGYGVFVSTDSDPTSTDNGITVTHSGTDPTAAVSGLSPGTQYYVSVVTTTVAGPGDPAPLTFFTGEPSTLTISQTASHLKYGQQLTLSGHLDSGSKSLPNQSVVLYGVVGTTAAHAFKTVLTDTSGDYSYTFVPPHNATYYAAYAGATGSPDGPAVDAAQSTKVKGTVAQAITLKGAAVHHFKWLQLTGKVSPAAAGRTVVIYNRRHGHLHKYASAKLGATSTYKLVLKHVTSGRYKLYAKITATSVNLAGTSKVLPVLKP